MTVSKRIDSVEKRRQRQPEPLSNADFFNTIGLFCNVAEISDLRFPQIECHEDTIWIEYIVGKRRAFYEAVAPI
jgi:hypothetical protein